MRAVTAPVLFGVLSLLLVLELPVWSPTTSADQAQYFYDELGRLVAVVDGTGQVAVYRYDEVGNLLTIERFASSSTGIGIFTLAPGSARVGTAVTIQGFGFSETAGENQVKFNGVAASVLSATETTLVATVPPGATTGPVMVTNANGTATSPHAFTVLVPPIITGIEPNRAAQGTTSQIRIDGFNLIGATAVTFARSGLSASILPGGTSGILSVNLTVGTAVPPGSYGFSVQTPAGTADSGDVKVTVTIVVPSFGLGKVGVLKPAPGAPSGPSFSVVPPTSVQMP